jgi:hypothetical protein
MYNKHCGNACTDLKLDRKGSRKYMHQTKRTNKTETPILRKIEFFVKKKKITA